MKRVNEDRVLEWCNKIREEYGLGDPLSVLPPDATPEDVILGISTRCPVGAATGPCGYWILRVSDFKTVNIPLYVREFMQDHDRRVAQ